MILQKGDKGSRRETMITGGLTESTPGLLESLAPDHWPQPHLWILVGSLACVVAACWNSLRLIRRHLEVAGPRVVRSATGRILFMVPLYSVESWLALVCGAGEFNNVLSVLRKGYECLLVLAFAELLLVWLGGLEHLIENLDYQCCRHLPPCSLLLPSWAPASRFVRRTLLGVLQYVPCSVLAISVFMVSWIGTEYAPPLKKLQVACMVCMNASQACAVYCLLTFYAANRAQLGAFKPIQKMLSVKFVFFLAFWQEMVVRTAEFSGAFNEWPVTLTHGWSSTQVGGAVLNCLICLEMFVLSLMHPYVWPPGEASQAARSHDVQDTVESKATLEEAEDGDEGSLLQYEPELIGDESGCEVCRRFLRVFDLSDIPVFVGSVRRLGKQPGKKTRS